MLKHLPNLLSGLRLLAAPLAAWLVLHEHDTAALAVFVAAGLSGTLTTAAQVAYIGAWLLLLAFDIERPDVMLAAAYGVAAVTLLSAAAYAGLFLRALFFGGRTA
jgi:hypothetical protein